MVDVKEGQRLLDVAIHEAGHVVATMMRGGIVGNVNLDPGMTYVQHRPVRRFRYRNGGRVAVSEAEVEADEARYRDDDAFVSYGGPWATARNRWTEDGPMDIEYVDSLTDKHEGDYLVYADIPAETLAQWSAELERQWPVIKTAASKLYLAHVDSLRRSRERAQIKALRRNLKRRRSKSLRRLDISPTFES